MRVSVFRSGLLPCGVALVLSAALPKATLGAVEHARPPAVDLDALRVEDDAVTAPTEDGQVAVLTLVPALQRTAEHLLANARPRAGAIIALDPRTGRLLSWVGMRDGQPAPRVPAETLAPAASVFKIVTTTALLEKYVPPEEVVCVKGGSRKIRAEHLLRPRSGHALCGPFREALGRSRNAVFAQLATRYLHPTDLENTALRLGFGTEVPSDVMAPVGTLDVPEGRLPFARAAAGFVGSRLSPLGAAHLATTVAALGQVLRLRLVEHAGDYSAPKHAEFVGRAMQEATARELVKMMEFTIHSGTSRNVFADEEGTSYLGDVRVAGKTGTLPDPAEHAMTSWFIGFAPSRAPRIVVSVMLENGSMWREKANEVGRDMLRSYFAARGARGVVAPE